MFNIDSLMALGVVIFGVLVIGLSAAQTWKFRRRLGWVTPLMLAATTTNLVALYVILLVQFAGSPPLIPFQARAAIMMVLAAVLSILIERGQRNE